MHSKNFHSAFRPFSKPLLTKRRPPAPYLLRLALLALAWAVSSSALAEPTSLVPNPVGGGDAYVANYSASVVVQAKLEEAGVPLANALVGFYVRRVGEADGGAAQPLTDEFLFADGFTAQDGVVTVRLKLFAGAHGQSDFIAAPPSPSSLGELYRLRMVYLGDLPEGDPGCVAPDAVDAGVVDAGIADAGPGDAGLSDAGLVDAGLLDAGPPPVIPTCSSETELDLFVASETSNLVLAPGNEVPLGESIPIIATLSDADGDEPPEGQTETAKALAGRTVTFFYDLDGNGAPAANERLGTSETNGNGQAVFDFVADPTYVVAGAQPSGLHAQFGGDDQYGLSGASVLLTVFPGGADPERTLLTADPSEISAGGGASTIITAVLIDAFNNPLDIDAPEEDVNFTSTLGVISDIERDVITGDYSAVLTSTNNESGDAVVTIEIAGIAGESITVKFLGDSCACDSTPTSSSGAAGALFSLVALFALAFPRRRRRHRGHS